MGVGYGMRDRLAVRGAPALPQPVRRVQAGGVLARQILLAFARDPPQHGIDQTLGVAMRTAGQRHGLGHGGVRRGVQEQELRGAEPEQVVHADGLGARAHEPVEQQRRSGRAGATRW